MKKVFFLLGLGLLPMLVAIVLVYLGSLQDSAALEYWTVAPWFIIAAIPICGVTFFIAFVTLVIYERVSGSTLRKKKFTAASFVVMTLAAGGIAAALWTDRQRENQELIADQKLVLQFVKNHPLVIQTASEKFDVYPS